MYLNFLYQFFCCIRVLLHRFYIVQRSIQFHLGFLVGVLQLLMQLKLVEQKQLYTVCKKNWQERKMVKNPPQFDTTCIQLPFFNFFVDIQLCHKFPLKKNQK
eukprot:TRINITY_DN14326_c0_g1_i4.p10 TRINITY_DN14326_c0_g1~~TRINITY_DN14326_c0_g1_i4.p10  ORF type:complete len:102 (+),score=4.75 TRINITY_DN14326_c0_g1_i4:1780-2085(+)